MTQNSQNITCDLHPHSHTRTHTGTTHDPWAHLPTPPTVTMPEEDTEAKRRVGVAAAPKEWLVHVPRELRSTTPLDPVTMTPTLGLARYTY